MGVIGSGVLAAMLGLGGEKREAIGSLADDNLKMAGEVLNVELPKARVRKKVATTLNQEAKPVEAYPLKKTGQGFRVPALKRLRE